MSYVMISWVSETKTETNENNFIARKIIERLLIGSYQ